MRSSTARPVGLTVCMKTPVSAMRKPYSTAMRCSSALRASKSASALARSLPARNTTLLTIVGCGYNSTMSAPTPFLASA